MKRVAFLGSGEMARHIAHYMIEDRQFEIAGYFDDYAIVGDVINGYPIIGKINNVLDQFKKGTFDEIVTAIGFTRLEYRKDLYNYFKNNIPFATFVHSSCFIDYSAILEEGVVLFPNCIIDKKL
jgi:FlaA1/EpsC-like NDP-sugar epimerase